VEAGRGVRHAACHSQAADPRGPEPPPPSRFPLMKIGEVLALWGVYLALQLVKSRYNRCAAPYFGIFSCQVLGWVLTENADVYVLRGA